MRRLAKVLGREAQSHGYIKFPQRLHLTIKPLFGTGPI